MVAERRFGPIVLLLFVGFAVLLARLFQVQILEHETWAREAKSLVRSSRTVPYHRGEIVDRNGRVLVRDDDVYEVEFCYRDFRRGHPLGLVAHARSALELRAVPIAEALANLEGWGNEIVVLSSQDFAALRHGAGVTTPASAFPPTLLSGAAPRTQAERELCSARASDVRFYAGELLHVTHKEQLELRKAEVDVPRTPLVALLAKIRGTSAESLVDALRRELSESRAHLAFMAELLRQDSNLPEFASSTGALDALVAVLERARRDVEDSVADALFAEAAGFAPGRLDEASLVELVDVDWIARMLRWDEPRELAWLHSRRAERLRELDEDVVPRILLRMASEDDERARAGRLLDELAEQFVVESDARRRSSDDPIAWQSLDALCVLADLDALFPARAAGYRAPRAVLPLQDPDVRAAWRELEDPWIVVGAVSELATSALDTEGAARAASGAFTPPRNAAEAAARWRKISRSGCKVEDDAARAELAWLAGCLERRFTSACDRALRARSLGAGARLAFADERLDRAREQEKFIQRDRQNRTTILPGRPSYDLVHLLARYPDRYRGFDVREATRRVPVACDPNGRAVARLIVGSVRRPSLSQLFAQSGELHRLTSLRSKLVRSDDELEEMRKIAARLYRSDELTGGFGVEEYFDAELRGKFGYRESEGLEQRASGAATLDQPPVHGKPVKLTLDVDLQLAAEHVIEHPDMPRDSLADGLWVQCPVGAIVLITPDGDVLAAASSPMKDGQPKTPGRDAEHTHMRERTLQMPTFNPPGSVFKPFVAAYALEHMHFDPRQQFPCVPLGHGKFGYRDMHCHGGHDMCDLHRALADSCNAYFAQVGERFKPEDLLEMAHLFGFGEPTGICRITGEERRGIREDVTKPIAPATAVKRLANPSERMRYACGLGMIEATPMQVARATAGILTGRLPELRIDSRIGDVETPHASRDLGLSPRTLEIIHDAMAATVNMKGATANDKGLDRASLGFGFACKTGSADIGPFVESPELTADDRRAMEAGKVRKHTWIAGWFPADDPKAVLVVYMHDVSETANHTSVYVAAQFLRSAAVRKFVEDARTSRAGDGDAGAGHVADASSPASGDARPIAGGDVSRTNPAGRAKEPR
jgi:penicillin-binding protein 2